MDIRTWVAEFAAHLPIRVMMPTGSATPPMGYAHKHDCCEVSFMLQGQGRYDLLDGFFEVRERDFAVFGPGVVHELKCGSGAVMFQPCIVFPANCLPPDCRDAYIGETDGLAYRVPANANIAPRLHQIYGWLIDELQKNRRGYQYAAYALLVEMSVLLSRYQTDEYDIDAQPDISALGRMDRVLGYIRNNWNAEIRLTDIAAQVHLEPSYFSTLFRRTFGMSLWNFIVSLRVERAVRMLLDTDEKVSSIAIECGFGSTANFYRHFTRLVGNTPSRVRNRNPYGTQPNPQTEVAYL